MAPIVHVAGLRTGFTPGLPVLDGVELIVPEGQVVALVGANGAGKTTLLRSLVGLVPAAGGEVVVDGTSVVGAAPRELRVLRRRVGFAFQRSCLARRLTALHNVLHGAMGRTGPLGWWPATAPREERDAAWACLDRVGLAHVAGRPVATLSGGQQQRVALARTLMQRPRLVLADEPVASLDPAAGVQVMELLRGIAREDGLTVMVALHQLDYARRFADRVVGLAGGRVQVDRPAGAWAAGELDSLYAAAS